MKSDLTRITSLMRTTIQSCELASGAQEFNDADARLALDELHKACGLWQRRIWEVLHNAGVPTQKQVDDSVKAWREFTNDQRVVEFCEQKKLTLHKGRQWYWCTNQRRPDGSLKYGAIIGLEHKRGVPRITNGVDVWIELEDGEMFLGHRDWWKGEKLMGTNNRIGNRASGPKAKKAKESIEELNKKILEMLRAA